MSKQIGIVVCNYNKQDYVVNCIKSLFESDIDFSDVDVYVVDNASTDESVAAIREAFGNKVTLLVNSENLGGSGGFNTGLRKALESPENYKYLMCVDNDIVFDKSAIRLLKEYLDTNEDTAVCGSMAFYMDEPGKIWNYGGKIDFESYIQKDLYKNRTDIDNLPDYVECDYVPACSLMVRRDAVMRVGIMPDDNFIYWDDMEWGYRFNTTGYKVVSLKASKVWHKAGGRNAGNTFIHYYMQRNRINFFMNALDSVEKKERFLNIVLAEYFRTIYSVNLKGEANIAKTLMNAIVDAAKGVRGKAVDGKILPRPTVPNRVENALSGAGSVTIKFNGMFEGLGNIVKNIKKINSNMEIVISTADKPADKSALEGQYKDCKITDEYEPEKTDAHLVMCDHIFKLTADMPKDIYIDSWCNIVYTDDDFEYAKSYRQTSDLFVMCMKALFTV